MDNENSEFVVIENPRMTVGEKWCESFLVTYPVSYSYNGGMIHNGKWYKGFKVKGIKAPEGFELVGIGCGLQLNAKPPFATAYLKPINNQKVTKSELRKLLS